MSDPRDLSFSRWLTPLTERVLGGGAITRDDALRMLEASGAEA